MFIYDTAYKCISRPLQVSSYIPLPDSSMSLYLGPQSENGHGSMYSNMLFQEYHTSSFQNQIKKSHI